MAFGACSPILSFVIHLTSHLNYKGSKTMIRKGEGETLLVLLKMQKGYRNLLVTMFVSFIFIIHFALPPSFLFSPFVFTVLFLMPVSLYSFVVSSPICEADEDVLETRAKG